MSHHDLPDVAATSQRLASNNARVAQSADALLAAVQLGDWNEVQRISESLADGEDRGSDTIHYRAERVCEELKKPNNVRAIKQSVVRLIGACGRPGESSDAPGADWQI